MSAHDRARTIATAIAEGTRPTDLIRPGRLQTLRAVDGGVLARRGHTEAAVDLARLAGFKPAGVICEIMKDDGTMARMPDLERFAREHDLKILRIADLIAYRQNERQIRRRVETAMPTRKAGSFRLVVYSDNLETQAFVALVKGEVRPGQPTLVRLHSQCLTGDVFGSERCDCGEQLDAALPTSIRPRRSWCTVREGAQSPHQQDSRLACRIRAPIRRSQYALGSRRTCAIKTERTFCSSWARQVLLMTIIRQGSHLE